MWINFVIFKKGRKLSRRNTQNLSTKKTTKQPNKTKKTTQPPKTKTNQNHPNLSENKEAATTAKGVQQSWKHLKKYHQHQKQNQPNTEEGEIKSKTFQLSH